MPHPGGAPKGSQNNLKHGLSFAKRALTRYGSRAIDQRTHFAKELAKWRRGLVQDLGGDVSTQQDALVDLCCKNKLLLDSVDAWLLTQKSIINKRNKCLYPVVRERQVLADSLSR